jgi:Histidine kinase-, DNA gyrase B-, and HSP90-like ATPase
MSQTSPDTVNIRPGVNVLSVLRHLNYKPWYALGEFVDNAVQSALENWEALKKVHGENYVLVVRIDLDPTDEGKISIRDNAAGIAVKDYQRAFRTAEIPPSRKGLSEFGMGMKSAGFWFSTEWSVRTKALGEIRAGQIQFDLAQIMEGSLEQLPVTFENAKAEEHYTELVLNKPQKMPAGRTIAKIKDHLTGIYRQFLRAGKMELYFRGEKLSFKEPAVLIAPHPRNAGSPAVKWHKPIDIKLSESKRIHGFVAIREEGSLSEAGLALFRRNRLIVGSGDEGYRPEAIFGHSNDFRYQRVFGELHMEGFGVSHTKDGFQWDELEEEFQSRLKAECNKEPLPMLKMAVEHRVRAKTVDIKRGAQAAVSSTAALLQKAGPVIAVQRSEQPVSNPPPETLASPQETAATKELVLDFNDQSWTVSVEIANDPAIGSWLEISQNDKNQNKRTMSIRVNFAHPFMQRFAGVEAEDMEPYIRFAVAVAIAETVARDQGVRQAGTIRRHINALLKSVLSEPGIGGNL